MEKTLTRGKFSLPTSYQHYSVVDQQKVVDEKFNEALLNGYIEYVGNNEYKIPTQIAMKLDIPILRTYKPY